MRNFILEGKKIARPVLFTTCLLTLLTCILSCTLYREYTIHFELDPWAVSYTHLVPNNKRLTVKKRTRMPTVEMI